MQIIKLVPYVMIGNNINIIHDPIANYGYALTLETVAASLLPSFLEDAPLLHLTRGQSSAVGSKP